ncbi:recombinase family protein [Blautia producta]|uniref:recombinase family protein n=1 Tax=Blautia producta TaxID=33035 RepID=UPI0031B60B9F
MVKAAIYVRVSTVMQVDKESRGVQKNDLIRYSKDILGISDYKVFEDAGYSAGSTDRPDYQKMLQRIRTGEFSHLLVWKIDRISRNIIDFTDMYQELQTLGVTFISLAEQFDTSSIVGQALLKMILIFAELERHNAAERSKAVLLSKTESGEYTGFRIPFGYRRDSESKEYSIEEVEANIIRMIFDMYDQGTTVYAIAKHLNNLPLKERVKEKWQMPTIERMLTNVSYTGVLRYNYRSYTSKKERVINDKKDLIFVENDHPAIITKEQFERCQQRYTKRKDTVYHVRKPLFADLLICNEHRIPLSWLKENNRKFSSPARYSCPYCSQNSFTDDEIGSFVLNYILNLLQAFGQVFPSTSSMTLKRMLLRGKDFDGVTTLVNAEEIKHSLLGDGSTEADIQDKQRKLKFELQIKERELERLKPYETVPSDVLNNPG